MFEKLNSFTKKVADLADRPALNPADLKAVFDAAPDEVRQFLNKLIDALQKTELGDSGAKNIGATPINGLTGTDVQTLLESIATTYAKKVSNWQAAGMVNSFQNLGLGYYNLEFKRDDVGVVWIRGAIKNSVGGNVSGTAIFQLPAGSRPASPLSFKVYTSAGEGSVYIDQEGYMRVSNLPATDNIDLRILCFPADQ